MPQRHEGTGRRIRIPKSRIRKVNEEQQHFTLEVIFDWSNCGYGYVQKLQSSCQPSRRVALGLLKNSALHSSSIVRDRIMNTDPLSKDSHSMQFVAKLEKKVYLEIKKCRFYDSNGLQNNKKVQVEESLDQSLESACNGFLGPGYVSLREGPLSKPEESLSLTEEAALLRILVSIEWRPFISSVYLSLVATIGESLSFVRVPESPASHKPNKKGRKHYPVLVLISERASNDLAHKSPLSKLFSDDLSLLPLFARDQRIIGIINASNEDVFTECLSPSTFLMCMWKLKKVLSACQTLRTPVHQTSEEEQRHEELDIELSSLESAVDDNRFKESVGSTNAFHLGLSLLSKSKRNGVSSGEPQTHNFLNFEIFWGLKSFQNLILLPNSLSRPCTSILSKCYPFFVAGAAMEPDFVAKFRKCDIAEVFRSEFVMEPLKNLFKRMQRKETRKSKSKSRLAKARRTDSRKRPSDNEFEDLFFQRKRRRMDVQIDNSGDSEKLRYIEVYVTPEIYHSGFGVIDYSSCSLSHDNNLNSVGIAANSNASGNTETFATRSSSKKILSSSSKFFWKRIRSVPKTHLKYHYSNSSQCRWRPELNLPPIRNELGTFKTEWSVLLTRLRKQYGKVRNDLSRSSSNSEYQSNKSEPPKQAIKFVEHAAKSFSRVITEERNKDSGKLPIALSLVFEKVLTVENVKKSNNARTGQGEKALKRANETSRQSLKYYGRENIKTEISETSAASFRNTRSNSSRASILKPFNAAVLTFNHASGPRWGSNSTLRKAKSFAFSRKEHNKFTRAEYQKLGPHLDLRPQIQNKEFLDSVPCLSAPGDTFSFGGNRFDAISRGTQSFFSAPPSPLHTSIVTPAYISASNPLFSIRDVGNPDLGLNLDTSQPIDVFSLYYNHLSCPLPDGQLENLNSLQDKQLRESNAHLDFINGYFPSSADNSRASRNVLIQSTPIKMDRSVSHESALDCSTYQHSDYLISSNGLSGTPISMDALRNEPRKLGNALNINPTFVDIDADNRLAERSPLYHTSFSQSPRNGDVKVKRSEIADSIDSADGKIHSQSSNVESEIKMNRRQSTPFENGDYFSYTGTGSFLRHNKSNFYSANRFDRVNASAISLDANPSDFNQSS